MNDVDFERRLAAWLDEGPTTVSDRTVDAALAQLPTTRQRGVHLAPLRSFIMQMPQHIAPIAAAVAIIVAGLGLYVALSDPDVGRPEVTTSPTASPEATMVLGTFASSEFAVPFRTELEGAASTEGWAVTESAEVVTLMPDANGPSRLLVLPRDQTQLIADDGARPIGDDIIASLNEVSGVEAAQQITFDTGEPATVRIGGTDVPWVIAEVDADELPLFRTGGGEVVPRPDTTESWWLFDVQGPSGGLLIIYRGGDDPGTWAGSVMFTLESLEFTDQ